MPKQVRYGLWLGLLLVVAAVPIAMQLSSTAVEITVRDQSGPIAGAAIELRAQTSGDLSQAFTDRRGRANVEVWPGSYGLRVQAAGHESHESGPVEVGWGAVPQVNVVLVRQRTPVQ